MRNQDGLPGDEVPDQHECDLDRRVTELEKQLVTVAAALDAASRLRVATPVRLDQDIRIAGGQLVRRILEKGRLVEGYRATRRTG